MGGHTVVRGWAWPGSQRLANQRQGAWAGGNAGLLVGEGPASATYYYCRLQDLMYSRFSRTPTCVRQTDRQIRY